MTDYTPILKLPEVAPNQNQKEDTINTALAILESAMNNVKPYTLSGAGPFALTDDDFTRYFLHRFSGQTAAYEITVPAGQPRWFAVENAGSFAITVRCFGVVGGLPFEVPSGKIGLVVSDGADLRTVVPQSGMGLLQDLSDVSGVPTDKQVLRYDAPTNLWKPSTFLISFGELTDTPNNYFGANGKIVAVNAAGDGLEFVSSAANVNSFVDLDDTPSSYSGAAGLTVKVSSGGTGLIFAAPTFLEAADTPNSYVGQAKKYLRVKSDFSGLEFFGVALTDLTDGPGSYSGAAGKFVRVKSDGTGFEFNNGSGGPDNFLDLTDTPDAYTGQGSKAVRVKSDVSGLEFYTPTLLGLGDTPANYTGAANKVLRVNGSGNAVVFSTLAFGDLSNVPLPEANKWLRWSPTGTAIVNDTPTFLGLLDTPNAYAGNEGKYVYVKGDGSGLGFAASSVNLSFLELNDAIDTTYDSKTDMVPIVTIVTGTPVLKLGYYAFNKLAGVSLSSPTEGQILGYDADLGLWTNIDAPEGGGGGSIGVPSYGEHAYWRLLLHATDGSTVQYGIQEIQFKHSKTGGDLANGGTASASSDEFGTVSGAFDNVISGAWFSSTASDGEWIAYHFATPADVRYVTLQGSQSQPNTSPSAFSVQYSDDGTVYTTAWEVTGQNGWAPGQTREFHAPIDLFFTDLADAPPSYIGQALKVLRVNAGETALELFTLPSIPTKLDDLTDVQVTGTPVDGQVLAWDDATGVFKPTSVPGITPTAFTDLTDAPTSYAGEGGNAVRVKMTEDGLEFYTPGTGGGGSGGSYRGTWASGSEQVILNFESGELNPAFTYDAAGFNVVIQPDAVSGTTLALKFRPIGNGGLCYCELPVVDAVGIANFKVRYKVSSEGPDLFRVIQDGTTTLLTDSGNTGLYEEGSFPVTGDHTLRFQYTKDGSLAVGDDTVYISQITYFKTLTNPYVYGDTITYAGSYWLCRVSGTSEQPGVGDDWIKLPDKLALLTDVDLSIPPSPGQALVFDGASSKFKAGDVAGGSGGTTKYNAGVTPRTRLHRAATQSIASSTWTAVQWDTEAEDAINAFNSAANTRITIPNGIKAARVTAYANWVSPVSGATVGMALRRNGIEIGVGGGSPIVASRDGLYQSHLNFTSEWFPVTPGDYYEVFVLQATGSTANLNGPVTNYGENTYVQFEWDEGTTASTAVAGDFHAAHQGWRVLTLDSQTGTYATFSELKFYDRTGVQIATTGGKLFDTNSHASYPVQQAFDGNTSTYWSSLQQTSTGQLAGPGYIFATPVDVGSIKLTSTGTDFNTTNSPKNFVIQYTDDGGASWLTYATFSNQTAWGDKEERTFVLPLSGIARVGGARALGELNDVTIGTPKNGDVLTYDDAASTWKQKSRWGYAPPKVADFPTAVGTVPLTLSYDDEAGLMVDCGASASGDIQRGVFKALPSGDWSLTAKIADHLAPVYYNAVGVMLRESSTSKIVLFGCEVAGSSFSVPMRQVRFSRLPGLSGFTANDYARPSPSLPQWYRLSLTGSTLKAEVSVDGKFWRTVVSQAVTTGFTVKPDQIGLGCSLNYTDSQSAMFSVPYWSQSW
ncbi:tail protein [Caulobacter phage CcrBL10]|uniref:Putative tail protein n=1 Tax=Caulobacter phage CcrBL10 TaxID=2283269 RepID=A0A385EC74_9CAUD|nr:tail protein [Caulobacter phage CcrBL10]AXQ68299.1 putative tail protein [Caulobacter phage CcrBL10]